MLIVTQFLAEFMNCCHLHSGLGLPMQLTINLVTLEITMGQPDLDNILWNLSS